MFVCIKQLNLISTILNVYTYIFLEHLTKCSNKFNFKNKIIRESSIFCKFIVRNLLQNYGAKNKYEKYSLYLLEPC